MINSNNFYFSILMLNSVVLLASQLVGSPEIVASGEVSNHLFNNLAEEEGDTGNNVVTGLDKLHTCQVFGDSHITTFDGKRYSVWAGSDCTYILALDCYYASWFIYVTFVKCGEASKSVSSVVLFKQDTVVILTRGWQVNTDKGEIRMHEGRPRHLGSGVFVQLFPEHLRVHFRSYRDEEITLLWDGWSTVTVQTQAEAICGLCGNNNGNNADEFFNLWFHGKDQMDLPSAFVSSWKVDETNTCNAVEQYKSKNCSNPAVDREAKRRCDFLLGNPVFTTQCLGADLEYYLEQCYVDLCYRMDLDQEYPTECQIASSLAMLCEARGGVFRGWKRRLGCPESCSVRHAVFSTGCPLSYYPWRARCPVT